MSLGFSISCGSTWAAYVDRTEACPESMPLLRRTQDFPGTLMTAGRSFDLEHRSAGGRLSMALERGPDLHSLRRDSHRRHGGCDRPETLESEARATDVPAGQRPSRQVVGGTSLISVSLTRYHRFCGNLGGISTAEHVGEPEPPPTPNPLNLRRCGPVTDAFSAR